MADPRPEDDKPGQNIWRQIGRYSHLGFVLPASIVVGLAIGAALDHWLKTTWLTLAGLLVGCVAGFFEMIRVILQASKES
jgi:F0F1-type ATP synthase assembly protein I